MPWKEPGEKPREPRSREPWGTGGRGNGPDLDAWLRAAQRRLGPFGHGPLGVIALGAVLIVLWFALGGWTRVADGQVGVLSRFGRVESLLQPGLHLHFPRPIDQVVTLDVDRVRTVDDEAQLLTSDGQLVQVDYDVQYKIGDARDYLFAMRDPEDAVRAAAAAAVRTVVGARTLRQMLARVDGDMTGAIRAALNGSLAGVPDGMTITAVVVRSVDVPADVTPAFDAIAKAQADAATARETAKADAKRASLKTQARVASIKADAEAYRRDVVADAAADVARFDPILQQYQAAPAVTMHRLWLQTMQDVLTKNRVVVNTGSGSVIVQFPVQHAQPGGASTTVGSTPAPSAATPPAAASSTNVPLTSGPMLRGTGA